MDDDKLNPDKNQSPNPSDPQQNPSDSRPIFETTPVEPPNPPIEQQPQNINEPVTQQPSPETLQPEEIGPEVATAEEASIAAAAPFEIPNSEEPPTVFEDNRKQFLIIGGGIIIFIIIFFSILGLFFKGRGKAAKQVTLTYWGLWEEKSTIEPLINEYQAKHKNVTIDYQKMATQDYREKLLTRSKKGQGPDLFRFHNTWLPEIKDILTPLPNEVMSTTEFDKTFYPISKKDLKIDNSYYGIPLTIDGLVLLYNDSLFKKAGITNPPVTWDDIINYASTLTVKDRDGQIITAGIALGTAANIEHFSDIFGLFLVQNGGDIRKLNEKEAADALEAYRKFAEPLKDEKGKSINVWDENMPNSVTAFIQEKVAMIIVPSWEILVIKGANPDIAVKALPIPLVPGAGSKPISLASYWVEGVSRYSKNQLEAWQFIKFLSEKESLTKSYEFQSKTRLFGEPYSRQDLGPLLAKNEFLLPVIKQAQDDSYVTVPLVSRTYDNGLNDEISKYIENAINATIQGTSYSQALVTAKDGVDQVLLKYNIK